MSTPTPTPAETTETRKVAEYYPVELEFMAVDEVCEKDLFVRVGTQYVLYRKSFVPFTAEVKNRLLQNQTKTLYIFCESEREYHKFLEKNLSGFIHNESVAVERKAAVLYQCATSVIQDILEKPDNSETLQRSHDMVQNTILLLSSGTDAFIRLVSLGSHDYYTYTHSVNVMTFSMGLAAQLGVEDEQELLKIGTGSLLHDIGKSRIDIKVLNKPGKLDESEWAIMKMHPVYGYEIVKESSYVEEASRRIILNHHEKLDGSGYPNGLKGDQIDMYSQIVSICDAYDAMTTTRVYAAAKPAVEAFRIIQTAMKSHLNEAYVREFIRLLAVKKSDA